MDIIPPPFSEDIATTMVEAPDGRGAWLRAWPSGYVHYAPHWIKSSKPGCMDTVCGRTRIFWPDADWPAAKTCPTCEAKVRAILEGLSREAPGA
jgi:hypothetical protein